MSGPEELLPQLPVPSDAGPPLDPDERAARWSVLNRKAQLSVHPAGDTSYSLYADHALVGDGHLVLAVRPRADGPAALS